jgi:hypothetical protein
LKRGGHFDRRRPSARAIASPADIGSRIMAHSNSAKLPTICIITRSLKDVLHIMERITEAGAFYNSLVTD